MRFRYLDFQGTRLTYRIDGSGPPLIMIQGVGAHGTILNPQIEILSEHYQCLSFDNRGIGASQPAGKPLSTQQMATDVLALMDRLGWESAHLVGHSFGGLVALEVAAQNKARVRSLSLLCSFANGREASRISWKLTWIVLRLHLGPRWVRREAFMELVLPRGHKEIHSEAMASRLSAIVGHDIAEIPPITGQQVRAMRQTDLTAELDKLAGVPTLVVSADLDMIAPPSLGRAMAARIPGARFVEVKGDAHSFPILKPKECAALVMEHLAAVEAARGTHPPGAQKAKKKCSSQ